MMGADKKGLGAKSGEAYAARTTSAHEQPRTNTPRFPCPDKQPLAWATLVDSNTAANSNPRLRHRFEELLHGDAVRPDLARAAIAVWQANTQAELEAIEAFQLQASHDQQQRADKQRTAKAASSASVSIHQGRWLKRRAEEA